MYLIYAPSLEDCISSPLSSAVSSVSPLGVTFPGISPARTSAPIRMDSLIQVYRASRPLPEYRGNLFSNILLLASASIFLDMHGSIGIFCTSLSLTGHGILIIAALPKSWQKPSAGSFQKHLSLAGGSEPSGPSRPSQPGRLWNTIGLWHCRCSGCFEGT